MKTKPKILFVCSRNQLRSPTAERIFQNHPDIEARSAGLSQKSPHTLSSRDIEWADAILVMETKHRSRILDMLRGKTFPPIEVLNIPDEYSFMDEELIEIIYVSTSEFVKNEFGIILG